MNGFQVGFWKPNSQKETDNFSKVCYLIILLEREREKILLPLFTSLMPTRARASVASPELHVVSPSLLCDWKDAKHMSH